MKCLIIFLDISMPSNNMTEEKLLMGFFDYYIHFDFFQQAVDIGKVDSNG